MPGPLDGLACAWSGHGLAIVLYRNFYIVCNRGEKNDTGHTVHFFNPDKFTPELYSKIGTQLMSDTAADFFYKTLPGELRLCTLLTKDEQGFQNELMNWFTQADQANDNCTLASLKNALFVLWTLMALEEEGQVLSEDIMCNQVRQEYKKFTTYARREIKAECEVFTKTDSTYKALLNSINQKLDKLN